MFVNSDDTWFINLNLLAEKRLVLVLQVLPFIKETHIHRNEENDSNLVC